MKHFSLRKKQSSTKSTDVVLASAQDLAEPRQEAPDTPTDPAALFTTIRESAIGYREELLAAFAADIRQGELSQLEAFWEILPYHVGVVKVSDFALTHATAATPLPSAEREPAVPDYIISSLFLTECHNYLTGDPNGFERLHLVTGIELNGKRYTLDHMARVALSRQSVAGAHADQNALKYALIEMDGFGHHLHGLFHSHPGQGAFATYPSDIDVATHERFENGGYPLIGAIFVKGYVRFFSTNQPFTITLYGKGVAAVPGEKNVYKIEHTSPPRVSYQTFEAEEEGRSESR